MKWTKHSLNHLAQDLVLRKYAWKFLASRFGMREKILLGKGEKAFHFGSRETAIFSYSRNDSGFAMLP